MFNEKEKIEEELNVLQENLNPTQKDIIEYLEIAESKMIFDEEDCLDNFDSIIWQLSLVLSDEYFLSRQEWNLDFWKMLEEVSKGNIKSHELRMFFKEREKHKDTLLELIWYLSTLGFKSDSDFYADTMQQIRQFRYLNKLLIASNAQTTSN